MERYTSEKSGNLWNIAVPCCCQNQLKDVASHWRFLCHHFLSLSVLHISCSYFDMNSSLFVPHRCPVSLHLNVCEYFLGTFTQWISTELLCQLVFALYAHRYKHSYIWAPMYDGNIPQHLYSKFIFPAFILSAVWDLASCLIPAALTLRLVSFYTFVGKKVNNLLLQE